MPPLHQVEDSLFLRALLNCGSPLLQVEVVVVLVVAVTHHSLVAAVVRVGPANPL
ncbi:hypothetical protein [Escherichia coli]|uniref:hypothetical protein n=1 Tax=Escherichia coli TaxID=562 RepID=UPI0017855549|nr:hypothetical protein [Escherichia coli]MBE0321230.1 hypothetical protein [Escherichia coli]